MKTRRKPAIRPGRVFKKPRRREVVPTEPSKRAVFWAVPKWLPLTASSLLLLSAVVCLSGWFHQVSASPEAPNAANQSVLLFMDRPNVPMHALVGFSDRATGGGLFNTVYITLVVESGYEPDSVGFRIAVRGENFRRPSQEFAPKVGDCSLEVKFYSEDVSPTCTDGRNLQEQSNYFALAQAQVLSGTLKRAESGVMTTTLTLASSTGWTSAGSSRSAFALPTVGTGFRYPEWPPTKQPFGEEELFDPNISKLTVTYRDLQQDEKVELASPETSGDSGKLTWVQEGSNFFAAHGSTMVLGMQERQTNDTFIIGVLAGLVPLVVGLAYKHLSQLAERQTNVLFVIGVLAGLLRRSWVWARQQLRQLTQRQSIRGNEE